MRVVVAPDKFKGSLTAVEAAEAIALGVRDALPDAEIVTCPVADGGEGTLDVLEAAGARIVRLTPLGIRRHAAVREGIRKVEDRKLAGLDPEERRVLRSALAHLANSG